MEVDKVITRKFASDQPEFMASIAIGLLFRLAGEQTFGLDDLAQMNLEFEGIRIIFDTETNKLVLKLHRREEEKNGGPGDSIRH